MLIQIHLWIHILLKGSFPKFKYRDNTFQGKSMNGITIIVVDPISIYSLANKMSCFEV